MAGLIGAHNNPVFSSRALRRSPISRLIASRAFEISFRNPSTAMRDSKPFLPVAASLKQPAKTISAAQFGNSRPSQDVLKIWSSANAVCFDVDSTVCLDEGIDELADFCGAGKAVEEWTKRAMSGSVPFEEALAARLSLFNPSSLQIQEFLEKRPPRISPGIAELIERLMAKNIVVYLISGGFRQMINPVALQLGIPLENVFANNLLFGSAGEYVGFDANEPTSRSGGKATAVQHIRKVHNYKTMVMIGDGATDLEARAPGGADLFICFAGVVLREAVAAKADWAGFFFHLVLSANNTCVRNGSNSYSGPFEATTHAVVGGGGASLADFTPVRAGWSYGFVKLTAFNHSTLLLEYKKSSDGNVYYHFIISRDYHDIVGCAIDSCSRTTLAI